MSQELVQRTPAQDLVVQIRGDQFRDQVAMALPENVTPERFIRGAVTALMAKPEIADLELGSVFRALIQCAHDGLLPDGQEAAIVPHKGKATYMPMVGGYRKIAADHGWTLRAQAVYANDEFDYTEEPPALLHRPPRPGTERGDLIAAYAVATHKDGGRLQCVLHPDEIAKRRAVAQTQNVWNQWPAQMWAKTAARDLFADLPLGELDPRVLRVLEASKLEPVAAAGALYGPAAHEAFPATPPEVKPADALPAGTGEESGRQVEGAASSSPPRDTAAPSTPDADDEEPGEAPAERREFVAPDDARALQLAADAAGAVEIPNGKFKGKTIAERAALDEAPSWFEYILQRPDHPIHADVETYARIMLPDVYQAHAAKQGAAAA